MDIINILPDSVANQIAAGEVVDRPASAVKELLENAMDAGATDIQLIIKDAGRTLIQVIDNGCGMSDVDARLCFERHATSKIHRADDLFAIRTMGFRGEALASIAAVAQVELKTRQHEKELGSQVVIEGSEVKSQEPCTCSPGTSISVKNLFFNIPARRNFLKKDSIELSHIEEIFKRVALPNYKVGFSFYNNGRLLYDLKPGNFAQRIAGLFGSSFNQRLYHIEEHTEPVSLNGYIGKKEYAKRVRGEQYLFVNGRYIKHPGLSAAIEKAYTELIPERTYPAYFVMLDVDPQRIDVNIHPTKTEVRFIDESVIFSILRAATKKSLGQYTLANELEFNPSTEIDFTPISKGHIPDTPKESFNPNYNPFYATDVHEKRPGNHGGGRLDLDNFFGPKSSSNIEQRLAFDDNLSEQQEELISATTSSATTTPINYLNRYIITTLKSGMVVIDQQRAHERILYEKMMSRAIDGQASAQQLLFPVNCRFNAADSEVLMEIMPELERLGFVIDPLGQNTFVVTAAPHDTKEDELQNMLEQTINEYKNNMLQKFNDRNKSICLSLARQMAVHSGTALKVEEMQKLIADLFSCQAPNISPSGKRTMFIMGEQELKERFK
ncbi:MAG: DNA mismatch repair endonuclease MutL [Bacteroidales bacterium]|nr:DNA mismatch repair endonuclease MutL [Bacteroidales bacterium]